MMKTIKYKEYQVPCKDKTTGSIEIFTIDAVDFTHACNLLQLELDMNWIIGYGSM